MSVLLEVRGMSKSFRGLRAVTDASFDVPHGAIRALIGPNGAGKTTCFNVIAGVYRPDNGIILFDNHPIQNLRPDQVCSAGIGRTFQLVKPFAALSVVDNVVVGALQRASNVSAAKKQAAEIVERMGLGPKKDQLASSLTLPDRKKLEVARALATRPKLLLLDEVMAGLRPTECDQMVEFFREINRADGLAILLIEHVMRAVMALAQHVIVLNHGEVIARGTPAEVVRDAAVLQCYLGEEAEV
ncbi:MAG TPA: ABC transporter ATP-binding protein [Burkholderiales bacterium]|nr:ABC transporter ATP-binding protein [Burkholderiales bacterium]